MPDEDIETIAAVFDECDAHLYGFGQVEGREALGRLAQRLADAEKQRDYYKSVHDQMLPTTRHDATALAAAEARATRAEALLRLVVPDGRGKSQDWVVYAYTHDPYAKLFIDGARAALTPTEEPEQ